MTVPDTNFRPTMIRARAIGKKLIEIYKNEDIGALPELTELLDIAEARLAKAGYFVDGAVANAHDIAHATDGRTG